ncbi:MAG: hypothetical protein EXQ47_09865 [Bryobacterales bacterium]|nr:hypothetical protein [Bryobacterales bacterium]
MNRVTVKTSTIFIAKRGRTQVFRSVNEVPPKLRKELEESTNSFNSATILIADRRGRAEIIKALNGLPSGLRSRLTASLAARPAAVAEPASTRAPAAEVAAWLRFLRRKWLEITLPSVVVLVVWVAFHYL